MRLCVCLSLLFAVSVSATDVTPTEKVISLLEDLKAEVEDEGKKEATVYDTFACFCQSMTEEKSENIKTEQDNVDTATANIESQTLISRNKAREIEERSQEIESVTKTLADTEAAREKEKMKYEANEADLSKGISNLENAIADLKAGLPGSFAQVSQAVRKTAVMADLLGLTTERRQRSMTSFLQGIKDVQDGPPPANDGSSDIVSTMQDLLKDFKEQKANIDQIEGQNKADYKSTMKSLNKQLDAAKTAKSDAEGEKDTADGEIASNEQDLTNENAKLSDDKLYLLDLTRKCELKAREFDQHSQARAGEITALGKAIDIISNRVKDNADESVSRAALLQAKEHVANAVAAHGENRRDVVHDEVALVQLAALPARERLAGLLQQGRRAGLGSSVATGVRAERAADLLGEVGSRIGSPALSAFALRLRTQLKFDPFVKVKKLIQDLIQRMVEEAAAEATKKGWCDTEMGKATHTRDKHMEETQRLNSALEKAEAQKAQLETDISDLTTEIADLEDALFKSTKLREAEKVENEDTVSKAKAGLEAVNDAYKVLEDFYKKAKKNDVSLAQKASPIDEDAPEAPSGGAYKGNQDKAGGILAMLDVIVSDFERTIRVTESTEKSALREFVEFERTSKTSIASKTSSKEQAEASLKSTDNQITEDMDLLGTRQKMLDDTLKELEDLKPTCVDTGMSYEERVQKREEEIDALKKAMCMLDGEGVEPDC